MKSLLISLLLLSATGCSSSSSDNVSSPLVGTWLSNCHEHVDGNGVFIVYAVNNIVITGNSATTNTIEYSDINCTIPNGITRVLIQEYTLAEDITTTDGVTAQRITLTSRFDFLGNPVTVIIEAIYRITGVELNFGDYVAGNAPSLDYSITYVKQ